MTQSPSSLPTRPPAKHPRTLQKNLVFGPVELIPELGAATPPGAKTPSTSSRENSQPTTPRTRLRRSPTPVLTSLTDLTNAHIAQLASVWNEKKLPSFEEDRQEIADSRNDKDPFDF